MMDLTRYQQAIGSSPVAVYGIGLSGLSTIRALRRANITVTAWDERSEAREAAAQAGAQIADLAEIDWSDYAALILSPGIPLHYPSPPEIVQKARAAGIEIIGDIELLDRAGHGRKTIGITGTNGKSTTTALLGHVLKRCGVEAAIGGNIGKPVLDLDVPADEGGVFIVELSSYQLDLCRDFAPDIAVHLNLTPDHIDRHGDLKGYIAAKMRIFRGKGIAVMGVDDAESLGMLEEIRKTGGREIHPVSVTKKLEGGVYVDNGVLYDALFNEAVEIGPLSALTTLQGVHNHQNIAAAYTVARLMGLKGAAILKAMETYPGLPHRMLTIRRINGVSYVNDSKATNADAASRALSCYKNIYWILGGQPKEGGLAGLENLMSRVRHGFVIGAAAEDFAAWLGNYNIPVTDCGTLDRAVMAAHDLAQKDRGQPGGQEAVLFSPACASFDQFRSFEHRGEVFTDLVRALPDNDGPDKGGGAS